MATTDYFGVGTAVNLTHYFVRGVSTGIKPGFRWNEASGYFELTEAVIGAEAWKRIHTSGTIPLPVAQGDMLLANATPAWALLTIGVANRLLRSNGTTASWAQAALTTDVTGVLPEANGGTNQSTYTLGDILYSSAANTLAKLAGQITTTRKFLRQTGTGAVSAAPVWDTILAADVPGSALTASNDTNVTLTLGGTPTTALLAAASITAGWSGTLSLARGGTAAGLTADLGAIVYSTGSALALLASTATAGQVLRSGASAAPTWSTATYPATVTVSRLLYASATNVIADLATANSGVLVTDGSGVPSIGTDIPTAITIGGQYVYRVGGTDVAVADGGTGLSSGTSGGILGYTASGTLASSVALTAKALLLGGGAGATPTSLGAATNGQLPIGNTGNNPTLATITAGSGISVTNGAGSITVATSGVVTAQTHTVSAVFAPTAVSAAATADLFTFLYPGNTGTTPTYDWECYVATLTGGNWDIQIRDAAGGAGNLVATVTGVTGSGIKVWGSQASVPTSAAILVCRVVKNSGAGTIAISSYYVYTR